MQIKHFCDLGTTVFICLLGIQPVKAQGEKKLHQELIAEDTVSIAATKAKVPITDIPQISDIPPPHTSVKDLLAQQQQQNEVIQVTGVRLNRTKNGLELILETRTSNLLKTTIKKEGNNFVADIPNAQVRLTNGNSFRQDNPDRDITTVTVTNHDTNSLRVTVTGAAGLPKVELFDSNEGLVFRLATAVSAAQPQQPQRQKPSGETTQTQPSTQTNEPDIELTVTGTRDEVPLSEVPQSIQVVPRQVLEDRGVVRLDEFTDNVSGVQRSTGGAGPGSSGFTIRGFSDEYVNLRNGFRSQGGFAQDIANIDRVEVLKGPASILYGSGFQSGVVNVLTKQPLEDPLYATKFQVGSNDFYRGEVDLTGPLTQNNSLLYRFNFAKQSQNSFRDFVRYDSNFVAPSFTWKIGPRTTISLDYENLTYDSIPDQTFRADPRFLKVNRSLFVGEPDLDRQTFAADTGIYRLEHRFSDNWQFKQAFYILHQDITTTTASRRRLQADGQTLNREFTNDPSNLENLTFRNELFGKFNTGSVRHNLIFGVEYSRLEYAYAEFVAPIAPINIFNPVYGAKPTAPLSLNYKEAYGDNTVAAYLQDIVELLPNLKLSAGVRFDNVNGFYDNRQTNTPINEVTNNEFSPRVGIVYQPGKTTTLYTSWSNSFTPQVFGKNGTGKPFQPIKSEQYEVGIRQEFFDKRLLASLAVYQITRNNVPTPDPNSDDFFVRIQTGEQRSRGVELDVSGEILPGWKVIATYANTDAVVTKDNQIPIGSRLPNVPYNSASLWTTYEIQKGNYQGLGGGLGVVYAGDRKGGLPNTINIPSYVRTDAALFYHRPKFEARLNFKNLFNLKYFDTDDSGSLNPQEPFTVIASFSYKF